MKFLVEKGAKLDAKDKFDRTPLDVADGRARRAGRGRGGAPPEPPPVYEKTAALLKELASR